jgi:hypothetical protein
MRTLATTANFGAAKAGLSTVGYTVYDSVGAVSQARSTSGVAQIAASTGIYRALISVAEDFKGFVLWDTGDASIRYAAESINPDVGNTVGQTTDEIRTLLRGLNASIINHIDVALKRKTPKIKEIDTDALKREILEGVRDSVGSIKIPPQNVVVPQEIDFTGVLRAVSDVKSAVSGIKIPAPEKVDFGETHKILRSILERFSEVSKINDHISRQGSELSSSVVKALLSFSDKNSRDMLTVIQKMKESIDEILEKFPKLCEVADIRAHAKDMERREKERTELESLRQHIRNLESSLSYANGELSEYRKNMTKFLGVYRG